MDREYILGAINKLIDICGKNFKCENCIFYDEKDEEFACVIKNTQEIPYDWDVPEK